MAISGGRIVIAFVNVIGLALLSCVADGAIQLAGRKHSLHIVRRPRGRNLAGGDPTVFNVMNFGAKTDDKTDNHGPFAQAWNAACQNIGPAKLVIPPGTYMAGQLYFQGPCKGSNPIIVEIQGTIKGTTDISEFQDDGWITFEYLDGLILTGGGTLDGQGAFAWKHNDCRKNINCQHLPKSLKIHRVNNSVIHDIKSVNPLGFHMFVTMSSNITVHHLDISAPADSPNTDGIHVSGSSFVDISHSKIGTGDDCISVGQGSTKVSISNILCGPGHGISVGSLGRTKGEGPVNGVLVKDCTLSQTTNGVRIKTFSKSTPNQASGIVFQDIVMDKVQNPILIDQNYGTSRKKAGKASSQSKVKISDVLYRNIRGSTNTSAAVSLSCSSVFPCERVELVDIDLVYDGTGSTKIVQNPTLSALCMNVKVKPGEHGLIVMEAKVSLGTL
ncbi:Glycoside hydrolase, family 28 [Corchorus capsularis]|uniref:Polygalacturonase n=1 Tax=Corchorus capsularis TaxID=210143 RepID=A0A1R3H0Q5_COCAP|nr:Glycoside hydrolase, family 28 [Corchorus capsularis]